MKGSWLEFSTLIIALLAASLAVLPYVPGLPLNEPVATHVTLENATQARYPFLDWYTLNTDEIASGSSLSGVVTFHYRKDYWPSGPSSSPYFLVLTEAAYDAANLENFRGLSLFTSSGAIRSYENSTYVGYAAGFNLTTSRTDKYYFLLVTWGTNQVSADLVITQTRPAWWITEVEKYSTILALIAAVAGMSSIVLHRRGKRKPRRL
jgi:hypothetical protein